MALEIKILDYGDIELENSFLVLGHNCGRRIGVAGSPCGPIGPAGTPFH